MSEQLHVEPAQRRVITLSAVLGSAMVVMDSTIAGVALPHMQASPGATSAQIM